MEPSFSARRPRIPAAIRTLGALVGAAEKAAALADRLQARLAEAAAGARALPHRPRVYFEEWDDPMIAGIRWVSELVAVAGGEDVFADRAVGRAARDRFVTAEEVIARDPEIVVGSWCGKRFRPERVAARPGFARIAAVRTGALREIKSSLILQPGPAALTDGLDALRGIFEAWAKAS